MKSKFNSFNTYLEQTNPLPWTYVEDHPNRCLVNNHTLAINYVRFKLIAEAMEKYFPAANKILDVGVYPGVIPKLFYEYLSLPESIRYFGLGLGFTAEFSKRMERYGIELLECDLDRRLHLDNGRNIEIPMEAEMVDSVVFTDVIEHFFDPFYPLQEINRVSKMGAIMILTTDNLTRFSSLLALLRGLSCNVPLISGNLFYNGDWRPHFREYSREELFQLLTWSGFQVIEHKFYEADFGQYRVIDGHLVKDDRRKLSLKGRLADWARKIAIKIIPYLRDNHIIVAKKVQSYEDMVAAAPKIVSDMEDWLAQRSQHDHTT